MGRFKTHEERAKKMISRRLDKMDKKETKELSRGRETASRQPHKLETLGSSPGGPTKKTRVGMKTG